MSVCVRVCIIIYIYIYVCVCVCVCVYVCIIIPILSLWWCEKKNKMIQSVNKKYPTNFYEIKD